MKTNHTVVCSVFFAIFFLSVADKSDAQLKADFTSNVQSGCAPLIVAFQDKSTGNPNAWTWSLGNGATSTYQNPVTTYVDPGTYTVKLSIKGSSGKDSLSRTSYITVYANPVVVFNGSPTQGCFPLDVKFTNNSKAGSGTITNYLWDFGDGYIDSSTTATHTYTSSGTFDITLKVTNSYGCYTALTKSDFIKINDGVNAGFNLTSLDVCKTPANAVFQNTSQGTGGLSYAWDFGDGSTSTQQNPTHTYSTSGSYEVLLTVQSAGGCTDTASLPVNVHVPTSSFTHTAATCLNQIIHFTNSSSPAPIESHWDFGDGSTSTDLNPDKAFTKTGNFTVKLVNIFSSGCSDSVTQTINIATAPTAYFTADDTIRCDTPLVVNFTNKTLGNVANYTWDFGDGDFSSSANPSHTYKKQGSFTVTLTATNANGCANVLEKVKYINIQPVKITGFPNLPDSGCIPLTVQPKFTLNINYKIAKYTWDFGDGTTSNAQFPTHTYSKEGFFNVKLTVETEDGCSDTYTLNNAVLAGHKPNAQLSNTKDTVCAGEFAAFKNESTNGPITFLVWDGGRVYDAVLGEYFYKNYSDTGWQKVKLIAYNYGCPDTLEKDSAIYVLPPAAKMAFTMHCDDKQRVDFQDTSVADITRKWDFGDGTTSTLQNPTHTYASPGDYTVSLYATNNACHDTTTTAIKIINEAGKISITDSVYCRGNNIGADILNVNDGNIKNTKWDFGDGTIITVNGGTKGNHSYVKNGKFKVKATVTDRNNCQYYYETKDSITVYGPLANFSTAVPGVCEGSNVIFSDKSSSDGIHNIVKWTWNFGDGPDVVYNSATAFSHMFSDTGNYSIRLIATDSYGCSDSSRKGNYIFVTHPVAGFSISDSIACPGTDVFFKNTSYGENLDYQWDFGNGIKSNQKNPDYIFKNSGIYNPELWITDVNGCRDSIAVGQLKISNPVAKFNLSDSTSTCPPLTVNFLNKSTDFTSVKWDFGDGSPSVIVSPSHIYTYPGIYPVKLIVNGYGKCADTAAIKNITIKGPTGTISYKTSPVCYPDTIQFSASAKNTLVYTWDFSDGNTVQTSTNKISYSYKPGEFVPKLILQDSGGCKVSIKGEDTLKIYDVKANAVLAGNPACTLADIQFTDASTSGDAIIHHYWFFGDNTTVDKSSTTHSYSKPGVYNAYLIAETKIGCRDTFDIPAGVQVLPTPQITIIGDSSLCANASAAFAGTSATKDSTIKWNWDFGNGRNASGQNTSAVFNTSGNYIIKLIGSNSGGCSDTTTAKVKVNPSPKINAGRDTIVCQHGTYELNVTGGQTYVWSGPGLSCTNCASPTINPDAFSSYKVIGTDAFGCSGSDSVNINIITPTKMSVFGGDTICVGETAQLFAQGADTYQWFPSTYLDNAASARPIFTAVSDTTINYKVVGYTAKNCFTDTGYVSVRTFPKPQINIVQDEIVLNVGSSVQLHAVSSNDVIAWRWQPPQGLSSTLIADPVASPNQTTTYSVVASNGGLCVSRDQITIRVVCGNSNVFIPNTFSPNNDGVNDVFYPRGKGLFNVKSFRIFNRWGQLVFERSNAAPNNANDGWNGTFNGKPLAPDVYVYVIEMQCDNNLIVPFKGNITLIR
ncbi:MAG: PKD domain-containing protein [Parafilimonas sp.]|nr:PKD domain-containing protein [Parafilimonas sp.]